MSHNPVDPIVPPLEELFAAGKHLPRQPDIFRARILARAQAAVAAGARPAAVTGHGRRHSRAWLLVAACLACAFAMGAAAATLGLVRRAPPAAEPLPRTPAPQAPTSRSAAAPAPAAAVSAAPAPAPGQRPRARTARESYAAEVALLQRARVALLRHEPNGALLLLREHGRRFPAGRLAEQREALRVRSLSESGQTDEARRAAARFAGRFPRSVLLPGIAARSGRLGVEAGP